MQNFPGSRSSQYIYTWGVYFILPFSFFQIIVRVGSRIKRQRRRRLSRPRLIALLFLASINPLQLFQPPQSLSLCVLPTFSTGIRKKNNFPHFIWFVHIDFPSLGSSNRILQNSKLASRSGFLFYEYLNNLSTILSHCSSTLFVTFSVLFTILYF